MIYFLPPVWAAGWRSQRIGDADGIPDDDGDRDRGFNIEYDDNDIGNSNSNSNRELGVNAFASLRGAPTSSGKLQ